MLTGKMILSEDMTRTVQARERLNLSLPPIGKVFSVSGKQNPMVSLSSVRAGNIIGGGDWAEDRIVPDCIRALVKGNPIEIRNPHAVRPWQFVLDPLFGYLWLAMKMREDPEKYADAWNFGPDLIQIQSMFRLLRKKFFRNGEAGHGRFLSQNENAPHEAGYLKLDSAKSMTRLGWKPVYAIDEAVQKTIDWYRKYYTGNI